MSIPSVKHLEGWVHAALCNWARVNGNVQITKYKNKMSVFYNGKEVGVVTVELPKHTPPKQDDQESVSP